MSTPTNDMPFQSINWHADPHYWVKSFFNYMYQQRTLLRALDSITQRQGYAYNEEFCLFPDAKGPDPIYHFEGVTFGTGDEEVTITDEQCWAYVRYVAAYHTAKNPADAPTLAALLARIGG